MCTKKIGAAYSEEEEEARACVFVVALRMKYTIEQGVLCERQRRRRYSRPVVLDGR